MNAVSEDCNPVCSPNDEAAQRMAVNSACTNWDFQVPIVERRIVEQKFWHFL